MAAIQRSLADQRSLSPPHNKRVPARAAQGRRLACRCEQHKVESDRPAPIAGAEIDTATAHRRTNSPVRRSPAARLVSQPGEWRWPRAQGALIARSRIVRRKKCSPDPQFIEDLYLKRFGRERPEVVMTVEQRARELEKKKREKKERKQAAREAAARAAHGRVEQLEASIPSTSVRQPSSLPVSLPT